jgi:N-acetylglucosaminyl-diphospho-decaprenol L-rhamnosyltransferase
VDLVVSIVNHNNRELVLQCLDALAAGGAPRHSTEVVVLDNASEDGSVEALRDHHSSPRVIAQQHRAGFGANHNTVLSATDSRYVFFLNDDAMIEPGGTDALVDYMDSHPAVGALTPRITSPNGAEQQIAWRFLTPATTALYALALGKAGFVQSGGRGNRAVERASGCALLVRRAALRDAGGGFDEGFFMYSEDSDLCRRITTAGYEIHYVGEVDVVHHSQQSSSGAPRRRVAEITRSQRRYFIKHHGPVAGRVAAYLMAFSYASRAAIGAVMQTLPARIRPSRAGNWPPGEFALMAQGLAGRSLGSGLRESAEAFNAARSEAP